MDAYFISDDAGIDKHQSEVSNSVASWNETNGQEEDSNTKLPVFPAGNGYSHIPYHIFPTLADPLGLYNHPKPLILTLEDELYGYLLMSHTFLKCTWDATYCKVLDVPSVAIPEPKLGRLLNIILFLLLKTCS